MQIEGGEEELKVLYGRLLNAGARIDHTTDHGLTRSVYFFDPDGNRLEIFCEMMAMGRLQELHEGDRRHGQAPRDRGCTLEAVL